MGNGQREPGPYTQRLSHRKQAKVVAATAIVAQTSERVLVAFLNLSFVGRMRWLLTGKVK